MGLGDPLQTLCPLCSRVGHRGRSRVFAHSLNPWISSARVVESETVAFNASSSACVVSGCLLVYAA